MQKKVTIFKKRTAKDTIHLFQLIEHESWLMSKKSLHMHIPWCRRRHTFLFKVGPSIQIQAVTIVNETKRAILTGNISSNPLSTVSWYDGSRLLKFEDKVNSTYIIIEKARCTDTRTFALTASNVVKMNVTSSIQLIVNCKYNCI